MALELARARTAILRGSRPEQRDVYHCTTLTMACHECTRRTLSLFTRSFINPEPIFAPRRTTFSRTNPLRSVYIAHRPFQPDEADTNSTKSTYRENFEQESQARRERPVWAIQKEALREKLGGEAWNPRKKLSPDTMEGIRHLHSTQPDKFTTPVLAEHFKVNPEAIRRILKSRWQPSDEEYVARMARWSKRGERIWTNLVEMGVKPPKVWREMGVGRATNGERPKWKSRHRNMVDVRDSANDNFVVEEGSIIPVVGGSRFGQPGQRNVADMRHGASETFVVEEEDILPVVGGKRPREERQSVSVPLSKRL